MSWSGRPARRRPRLQHLRREATVSAGIRRSSSVWSSWAGHSARSATSNRPGVPGPARTPHARRHPVRTRVLPGRHHRSAQATAWRGHAVRALYLAAAAVDVAVERGDRELLAALERQWEHTVARRTYLTGGMGARHQDEGFGEDWELPPDRAYCETCAGRRLGHGGVAAVPGDRRGPVRRPDRADALQRRRHLAARRRPGVLLRQPTAPARAPAAGAGRGRGEPARERRGARAVVRRRPAAPPTSPAHWPSGTAYAATAGERDADTCSSTPALGSPPSWATGGSSGSRSRPTIRTTGW